MVDLKTADFDEAVSKGTVLVDFWATWCGPCKMMTTVLTGVENDFAHDDEVNIYKVNVDEEPELAQRFGVTNIPTLMFMRDGEVAKTVSGVQAPQVVSQALTDLKAL